MNLHDSTSNGNRYVVPTRMKIEAFGVTILIVTCLSYLILRPLSMISVFLGTIGFVLVFRVSTILFMEKLRFHSYCHIVEAKRRGEDVQPEHFHRPKQVENIKGKLTAVLTLAVLYFQLHLAASGMRFMAPFVGVTGLAIYFVIVTGFQYRWLIYKCFSTAKE